ncbi:MAG: CPBP family glutamic-type intramembrane protease [Actinomycetota bacterium]|nr:CPBP family glutamic-type intramembrane protease [Actinomycetota bacterium]
MTSADPRNTGSVQGWYPDPYGTGLVRFWDGATWTPYTAIPLAPAPHSSAATSPPLDRSIDRQRSLDPTPWGWRPAVLPCLASIAIVVLGNTATRVIRPHTFTGQFAVTIAVNALAYSMLGLVVWYAARDIAARYGGWGPAFGIRRPSRRDIGYAACGIGIAFAARLVVAIVANGVTHGNAGQQSQNIRLHTTSLPVDVLLVVIVVVLAPVIEEIIFRGLLLRTFMRRLSFWPAALASTFIFAAFHTYEVNTLAGALTLAAVVATLGLTNCVLVRLTDRLVPGMLVHAMLNAVATAVVIYQASN